MSGCVPSGENQSDEQNEPNFIAGKNLLGHSDYKGAVEAFEKSLAANPRSASAHYELGCLFDNSEKTVHFPMDAIYHYCHYLILKYPQSSGSSPSIQSDYDLLVQLGVEPTTNGFQKATIQLSEHDILVRQRIESCKLEVAKSVSGLGTIPSAAQREIQRLTDENKTLAIKVEELRQSAAQSRADAQAAARSQAAVPGASGSMEQPSRGRDIQSFGGSSNTRNVTPVNRSEAKVTPLPLLRDNQSSRALASSGMRSYVVQSGDNPAHIARKFAIPVNSLLNANPQMRPKNLVVGQTLRIPAH